jgi:hypothetical protein
MALLHGVCYSFSLLLVAKPRGLRCVCFGLSNSGIVDSNPAGGMSAFFCVVLSCVGRRLTVDRSIVEGVLSKCLKGFIVS